MGKIIIVVTCPSMSDAEMFEQINAQLDQQDLLPDRPDVDVSLNTEAKP